MQNAQYIAKTSLRGDPWESALRSTFWPSRNRVFYGTWWPWSSQNPSATTSFRDFFENPSECLQIVQKPMVFEHHFCAASNFYFCQFCDANAIYCKLANSPIHSRQSGGSTCGIVGICVDGFFERRCLVAVIYAICPHMLSNAPLVAFWGPPNSYPDLWIYELL